LSDEVRKAALEKAAFARRERSAVKSRLKHSGASLSGVIADGHNDDVVGKMRVADLLAASTGRPRPAGSAARGQSQRCQPG